MKQHKQYKLDIQVTGQQTEIREFLEILGAIQYLGSVGSNRDLLVGVDGDGTGRLRFNVKFKDTEWEELESTLLDTYQHPDKPFKFSIGE